MFDIPQKYTSIIIFGLIFQSSSSSTQLQIGGVFDKTEINEEIAFRYAVYKVNSNIRASMRLTTRSVFVSSEKTFEVSKAVCGLMELGVVGIFGPSSSISSPHVQSLCDSKEIPHIETHWDRNEQRSSVNVYPHPQVISKVYANIIEKWNWKKFTILYENDESLSRISELLIFKSGLSITVNQLELDSTLSYRSLLSSLKASGENRFVIDCSIIILIEVLTQAQQIGIISENYHIFITNLDLHTINLTPFQYGGCNITGVRMVNPEHYELIETAEGMLKMEMKQGKNDMGHIDAWKITLKTALLIDAVSIFFDAVNEIGIKQLQARSISCKTQESWKFGYSIINYLKTKTINGLTGPLVFDNHGLRTNFLLDIVELKSGGLIKVGVCNSSGINITRFPSPADSSVDNAGSLQNKSFIVITALTPPYGLLKESTTKLVGNDRFEGFGIDLIHELSLMLGFNYTFVIQEDGANGNYNRSSKEWNGMIREIIDGRADLAITDLTITSEREMAVDFTMPFMNLGISILYRKPEPVPPSLFSFASPFSLDVWMLLGVAYCLVSLFLFIIGRLCPSEWINPYPCIQDPEYLINQFTLRNSLWFTIGSFMQQGSEIAPIGMSTRMVAGVWWFFTLIMVSSYTAKLAAFLTVETLVTPFKNIEELAMQKNIKVGAKRDGATSNFFRDSDVESYKLIWNYMRNHPEDMTADNNNGMERVKTENYAFLMESTSIEYIVERQCALAQVNGLLDDKGYGIAMMKDSPYRHVLSAAVVKLQESGRLTELKIKWWKEKHGGGKCNNRAAGEATPLGLKNVEGVFFILALGTILGLIGTFIELALHVLRNSKNFQEFLREYVKELRFIFKFKNLKSLPENVDISQENTTQ